MDNETIESLLSVNSTYLPFLAANISCYFKLAITELLPTKIAFACLYTMVFVTALSGNSLVLYVVSSNKSMQTVTNLFIANLAVSDLLVNCTSLWLTPLYTYMGKWDWGAALCHALPLFQGTN